MREGEFSGKLLKDFPEQCFGNRPGGTFGKNLKGTSGSYLERAFSRTLRGTSGKNSLSIPTSTSEIISWCTSAIILGGAFGITSYSNV